MKEKWTREETIVAFYVYCHIPFRESRQSHPMIRKYASLIGRSPSALNMKVGNIGRLDPTLRAQGIVGLSHGAQMEEVVWKEFYGDRDGLVSKCYEVIRQFADRSNMPLADFDFDSLPEGKEQVATVKQRINQAFFRDVVLSAYGNCCCISRIAMRELVEACHIISWKDDALNRTNPENGLCMNPLFHKAYDKHLLSISPDYNIVISDRLLEATQEAEFRHYLMGLNGGNIMLPDKFMPRREFLDVHYQQFNAMR